MTICTYAHVSANISPSNLVAAHKAQGQEQVPVLDRVATQLESVLALVLEAHRQVGPTEEMHQAKEAVLVLE